MPELYQIIVTCEDGHEQTFFGGGIKRELRKGTFKDLDSAVRALFNPGNHKYAKVNLFKTAKIVPVDGDSYGDPIEVYDFTWAKRESEPSSLSPAPKKKQAQAEPESPYSRNQQQKS